MKNFKYTKRYQCDLPSNGYFNWKQVRIIMKDHYYDGAKTTGILLHNGKFTVNGVLFEPKEFKIIDENPLDLPEKELKKIKRRLKKIKE